MGIPLPYVKLVGTGNDFVLIDTLSSSSSSARSLRLPWTKVAKVICDRNHGVGADGLLLLSRSPVADVRMRIFNPDGTEPAMCGNGIRCLAWYAYRRRAAKKKMTIQTRAGLKRAEIKKPHRVRVDMGTPRALSSEQLGSGQVLSSISIDSGVPHLVCWVHDVDSVDVSRLGRRLRNQRRFHPQGTNVDFVEKEQHRYIYHPSTRTTAFGRGLVLRQAQDSSRVLRLTSFAQDPERSRGTRRSRVEGLAQDSAPRAIEKVPCFAVAKPRLFFASSKLRRSTEELRRGEPQACPVGLHSHMGWPIHRVSLKMRTYERGVEGETRACGTGAVAAATAVMCSIPWCTLDELNDPLFIGRESNLERFEVAVRVPGGTLHVELGAKHMIDERRLAFSHAFLEGEAREVSRGTFVWNGRILP